ncbi:hypothetical protein [Moraxella sp.]|nr:hypothetical protein [Moraxella sp.]MDO4895311.1 hypothetical protein [Moraxella sp.]
MNRLMVSDGLNFLTNVDYGLKAHGAIAHDVMSDAMIKTVWGA